MVNEQFATVIQLMRKCSCQWYNGELLSHHLLSHCQLITCYLYLPYCILLLYVRLVAARRNPFSEDISEAQFGTFARKRLRDEADRGGGRRMRFTKTHNRADDCRQVQQLTNSESDSGSPLTGDGGAGSNDDDNDFSFPVFCLVVSVMKEYLIVFHSHVCKRLMEFSKKCLQNFRTNVRAKIAKKNRCRPNINLLAVGIYSDRTIYPLFSLHFDISTKSWYVASH